MPRDLHFEQRSPMPASADELFAWHTRPGAFARLAPPWQRFRIVGGTPEIAEGSRVVLSLSKGPMRLRWVAEHRQVRPGRSFRDVQVEGPFALWEHDHRFEPAGDGASLLVDRIRFRPPAGALGRLLMEPGLRRDLERTFRYRHATTAADLEMHARFRQRPRLRVAVSGAGGLIGRALSAMLTTGGHQVVPLTRSPRPREGCIAWSPEKGLLEPSRVGELDAVIHLAGESISAGRWTPARKQRIRDSRVSGTRNLADSLARLSRPPKVFICASAIAIYGSRGDSWLDDAAAPGEGFLARVCADWERAALEVRELGTRVALARLGVVLSPAGGFLPPVLRAFRLGLGGRLGDGRQRVSWISVDDAAAALIHLLTSDGLEGAFNLAVPEAPSNRELARALAQVLRRPAALAMPGSVARTVFGEMADEMMLASVRAHPSRLLHSGFRFRHPDLEPALRHLLGLTERP